MRKNLLALALAATAPVAAVSAEVDVYGKALVTLQNVSVDDAAGDDGDHWELESNASRLGVKGSRELIDNLEGIFQAEYEIQIDDGSTAFKNRNTMVGLKSTWGTVFGGIYDTPVKKSQGKIDLFGDLSFDIKEILFGEVRAKNLIQYTSPKINDAIEIKVALIPGEENDAGNPDPDAKNGLADGVSASISFKQDGFYAALAVDSGVSDSKADFDTPVGVGDDIEDARLDTIRLVGQYKTDMFQIGALYQTTEISDLADELNSTDLAALDALGATSAYEEDEDGFVVSAGYTLDNKTFKLQYAASDMKKEGNEGFAIGMDKKLAKTTKVFAFLSSMEDDFDDEEQVFAVGIEHKFSTAH